MVAVLRLKDWEPSQLLSEGRRMDRTFDFTVTSTSRVTYWCSKVLFEDPSAGITYRYQFLFKLCWDISDDCNDLILCCLVSKPDPMGRYVRIFIVTIIEVPNPLKGIRSCNRRLQQYSFDTKLRICVFVDCIYEHNSQCIDFCFAHGAVVSDVIVATDKVLP